MKQWGPLMGLEPTISTLRVRRATHFAMLPQSKGSGNNCQVSLIYNYILFYSSEAQQLSRLQARNGYTEELARQRINAQMSLAEKCDKATCIIDNSGNLDTTKQQVMDIYRKLRDSKKQWRLRLGIIGFLMLISTVVGYFILR